VRRWFILGDSLLPHLLVRSFGCSPNQFERLASRDRSMRRVLRKSIPFVQAVLIGTLAAAAIAGVAMLIPHS
jgi:hypothetical protein